MLGVYVLCGCCQRMLGLDRIVALAIASQRRRRIPFGLWFARARELNMFRSWQALRNGPFVSYSPDIANLSPPVAGACSVLNGGSFSLFCLAGLF